MLTFLPRCPLASSIVNVCQKYAAGLLRWNHPYDYLGQILQRLSRLITLKQRWLLSGLEKVAFTMRFGSTAKVLLKCKLKYNRISEWPWTQSSMVQHIAEIEFAILHDG